MPATKTFTTQLAALAVLAIGLGASLDAGQLRAVPDEIERLLESGLDAGLEPIVAELAGAAGPAARPAGGPTAWSCPGAGTPTRPRWSWR